MPLCPRVELPVRCCEGVLGTLELGRATEVGGPIEELGRSPLGAPSQLASSQPVSLHPLRHEWLPAQPSLLGTGKEHGGPAVRMLKVLLGVCCPCLCLGEEEAEQVEWEAPGNLAILLSSTHRKHFCLFACVKLSCKHPQSL